MAKKIHPYALYEQSVQSPEVECRFIKRVYKSIRKKEPRVLREDFCFTFRNAIEWVKAHPKHKSHVLDIDPKPLEYGRNIHMVNLTPDQKRRIFVHQMSVDDPRAPRADVILATNFSWMVFKTRDSLKAYLSRCLRALGKDGILIMDFIGGSECHEPNTDIESFSGYRYYWEQVNFNPITHEAKFYIHFKPRGQKKMNRVFTYDWRLWTIPDTVDLLHEVGFPKTTIYWEGDDSDGRGNGVFRPQKRAESSLSWVAYCVACR